MSKRYLAVGVSIVMAIALLVWIFKIDPVSHERTTTKPDKPITPMGPQNLSPTVGKPPEKDIPSNPVQSFRKPLFTKVNEKDQLIQVFADRVDPKPQGVLAVVKPSAKIYLKPNQVLEIVADRGTFIAPDNQPRSGDFQGKAMIRLFDGPPNRVVDLSDTSEDVKLIILLENAHFDLELGQLDSPDEIRLMTPKMDFHGKGISLSYNEPEREIASIQVAKGDFLRLAQNPPARQTPTTQNAAPASNTPKAATKPAAPVNPKANRQYRIRFEKDIKISTPDADISADSLEVYTRNSTSTQEQMLSSAAAPATPADAKPNQLTPAQLTAARTAESLADFAQVLSQPGTQPSAAAHRADPMVLFDPSDKDIVIKWSGLFVIEPATGTIPDEAKNVDTFVRLIGQDLKVETIRREAVLAGQIDYTAGLGKLSILPRKDGNLWLVSPQMGAVRTTRVDVDNQKSATLYGPGLIITPGGPKDAQLLPKPILEAFASATNSTSQPQSKDDGLPPGLTVAWSKQMDLKFVDNPAAAQALGSADAAAATSGTGLPVGTKDFAGGKNVKLSDVTFQGNVEVQHADFALKTGRLALTFDARPSKDNRLILRMISADSDVKLSAVSNSQPVALAASHLLLELTTDEHDRIVPGKLMVQGRVTGSQGPSTLSAGSMEIAFAQNQPPKAKPGQQNSRLFASGAPPIKTISLSEDVVIKTQEKRDANSKNPKDALTSESVEIYSDQVDVEAQRNWVHLTTKAPKVARIVRTDGIITGSDLTLWDDGGLKFLVAKGPGELKYTMQPKPAPGAAPAKPVKGQKPDTVTVAWTGSMDYNEKLATALISDKVSIKADLEKEVTQIKANKLKIDLRPRLNAPDKASPDKTPVAPESDSTKTLLSAGADPGAALALQEFRYAHATGAVEMQAYKKPGPDGKVPSRLTIAGDDVRFDPSAQSINVKGQGWMLIEDRQQEAKQDGKEKAPEPTQSNDFERALRLSAGGDTLFKWKTGMVLDARENALTMNDDVQMIHKPVSDGDPVQLDCAQMVARLKKTADGLDGWLKAKGQRPDIDQIIAERDVRVTMKDQRMLTDKLVYRGDKREMTLEAFDGRMTQVFNPENPTGLTAQAIKYELSNSRLTVIDPGAVKFGEQPPEPKK
jgi:lipopolysaccharide export system protein LptA